MKTLTTILLLAASYTANTQVAINATSSPAASSAMLDISSANKGMLIPRVALLSNTDVATIPSPANSLLIYNTATNGSGSLAVTPGFYFWRSPSWVQLSTTSVTASTWSITGNANISESNNFIGTTDNQPIRFRANNISAGGINPATGNVGLGMRTMTGSLNGYSNVAIGTAALYFNSYYSNQVAIGDSALYAVGSVLVQGIDPVRNVAVGSKALYANYGGTDNTAVGFNSLYDNTTGYRNTASGARSLRYNTSGFGNTATGYSASASNESGIYNTAIGANSLVTNESGSYNSAIGYSAAVFATGNWNTAVGCYSLVNTNAGQANVAVGFQAMQYNVSGNNNTAIGTNAGPVNGSGAFSNSTAIGQTAAFTASNQVRVGNTAVTAIGGYADFVNISDIRFKKNVQPEIHGLDFILKLQPIVYNMDVQKLNRFIYGQGADTLFKGTAQQAITDKEAILYSGFSAQQVEETAKNIGYNFSGVQKPQNEHDHYALAYSQFVVPLVKAMQEQQQMIAQLQASIEELRQKIK